MDFNKFLTLFQPDKTFASRLGAAQRLWEQCSSVKQEAIIAWLETHGSYKKRNPYFFILDFEPRSAHAEPTNYRGREIPSGLQVFSAKYNGTWGMYTEADIEQFRMERPA